MPSVYAAAQEFTRRVDALDADALARVAAELRRALAPLQREAEALAAEVARAAAQPAREGETDAARLGRERRLVEDTFRARRARAIAAQVEHEIARVLGTLTPELEAAVEQALAEGARAARELTRQALPEGLTLEALAQIGRTWIDPNLDPVRRLIGATEAGSPLRGLLDAVSADAGRTVRDKLIAGLLAGKNPRAVGKAIAEAGALVEARATTIARTETLRAFRESSRASYQANRDIVRGFVRVAAHSERTCPMCLVLDGEEQDTDELLAVHPNDRCSVAPRTISWRDLGIDLPDRRPTRESGRAWFERQTDAVKAQIVGKGGLAALNRGATLADFVRVRRDPQWGPTLERRSLAEIGA